MTSNGPGLADLDGQLVQKPLGLSSWFLLRGQCGNATGGIGHAKLAQEQ